MYSIYLLKNKVNDKMYIGYTENFDKRMKQHEYFAYYNNKQYDSKHLYRAIRKYGWINFEKLVIYQSIYEENVKLMEEFFIRDYNTHHRFGQGYNMTYGGEGTKGIVRTEKTLKLMSDAQKGKKKSSETLKKLHISMLGYGDKISSEWIITDPNGNTFKIKNLNKFCREYNLDQGNMVKVSQGKIKHCKGYKCNKIS